MLTQCRARRIKCDESKPVCERCVRTGRKCDGYSLLPPRTWHEHLQVPEKADPSGIQPWYGGLLHLFGSQSENRAFQHFIMRTAPTMSCYCSAPFWAGIVPQASQIHPAVKHTMLALSALHESHTALDRVCQLKLYAAHQSQAVTLLTKSPQLPPVETILTSCLLFAGCDFLIDQPMKAMSHLFSGLRILDDLKESKKADPASQRLIDDNLWPCYASFAAKSSVYGVKDSDPSLDMHVALDRPVIPTILPDFFLAQHSLAGAVYWLRYFLDKWRRSPPDYDRTKEAEDVLHLLREWSSAFGYYETKTLPNNEPEGRNGALHLKVHHRLAKAIIDDYPIGNLPTMDDFEYMVNETKILIKLGAEDDTLQPGQLYPNEMPVTSGNIPPLYFTATRCTDTSLRRRALHLLASLKRAEGLWNSCLASRIAEQVILLEEEDNDSPKSDSGIGSATTGRILVHSVDTDSPGEGYAMMTYTRSPSPAPISKLVEWPPCDGHFDPSEAMIRAKDDEREAFNKLMRVSGCGQGLIVPQAFTCSCKLRLVEEQGTIELDPENSTGSTRL